MAIVLVGPERIAEAADALARGMLSEVFMRWLIPDPDQSMAFQRAVYEDLMQDAQTAGLVEAWGDPIVGVALWIVRPELTKTEAQRPSTALELRVRVPADTSERIRRYSEVIRQLREHARPDRHAYLDSLAVVPEHRRRGIAGRLLDSGHQWAAAQGLPCALETETEANVRFYTKRGYHSVAAIEMPEDGMTVTSMRRDQPPLSR